VPNIAANTRIPVGTYTQETDTVLQRNGHTHIEYTTTHGLSKL